MQFFFFHPKKSLSWYKPVCVFSISQPDRPDSLTYLYFMAQACLFFMLNGHAGYVSLQSCSFFYTVCYWGAVTITSVFQAIDLHV
ncbi:hypothetical protein FKM82_006762 [Ascaphus truei]